MALACVINSLVYSTTSGLPCPGHRLVTGPFPSCQVPGPELERCEFQLFHFLTVALMGLSLLSAGEEPSLQAHFVVRGQALKTSTKEVFLPLLAGRNEVLRGQYTSSLAVSTGRQHFKLGIEDA